MLCNQEIDVDIQQHFQEQHSDQPPTRIATGTWQEEIDKAIKALQAIKRTKDWKTRTRRLDEEVIQRLYETRVLMTEDR
jgi:hypothetical protein